MERKQIIKNLGLFLVTKTISDMGFEVEPSISSVESNIVARKNDKEINIKVRSLSERHAVPIDTLDETIDYIVIAFDLIDNPKFSIIKNDNKITELATVNNDKWIPFDKYVLHMDNWHILK